MGFKGIKIIQVCFRDEDCTDGIIINGTRKDQTTTEFHCQIIQVSHTCMRSDINFSKKNIVSS